MNMSDPGHDNGRDGYPSTLGGSMSWQLEAAGAKVTDTFTLARD